MPMRFQTAVLMALLAAAASMAQTAVARPSVAAMDRARHEVPGSADTRQTRGAAQSLAALTLDQAVALAERTFKARVVRADTQRDGERVVYVLRLLNSAGRVWTVRVDAQTGQMQ